MFNKSHSRGFSLLEVLVAMLILALVMGGLVNVFVASRGYTAHGRFRTSASQVAAQFMDPLQNEVNQSSWDTSGNLLNVSVRPGPSQTVDGVTYNSEFEITNESAGTFLRRVRMNVTWTDPRR
jgi:prepilin-type N-terminal cleavage/methylation domain-containing protein